MAKTVLSLLERSLQIVDQVGAGQTASAEDAQLAFDCLKSLVAELASRGIADVYIHPTDKTRELIDDSLWNPLADILAVDLRTTFSGDIVPDDVREGKIVRLRRITSAGPTYETLKATYF